MKKQKTIFTVMAICLIGFFSLSMSGSTGASQDKKNTDNNVTGTKDSIQYRLVDEAFTAKAKIWLVENLKNKRISDETDAQRQLLLEVSKEIKLPGNLELLFQYNRNPKTNALYPSDIMALLKTSVMTGNDISRAAWVSHDWNGAPAVQFNMTTEGAVNFAKATAAENRGKRLAIVIDNKIRSAPQINEQIVGGRAMIVGDFTMDEVEALINIIRKGDK